METKQSLRKISQFEFNHLYLDTLDDPVFRPDVDGHRHFRMSQLLLSRGFADDLSALDLRNRNFNYADFYDVNLDEADFSGAVCSFADFSGAHFSHVVIDANTKLYQAKFTDVQLLLLLDLPRRDEVEVVSPPREVEVF